MSVRASPGLEADEDCSTLACDRKTWTWAEQFVIFSRKWRPQP